MALQRAVYRPRDVEHTVLHQVVAEHLETFLGGVAEADGASLPQFVECEFREFLTCGVVEHCVAWFWCEGCAHEHLVPFSCRGRAWCPSCATLHDPAVIRKILAHLALSRSGQSPGPASPDSGAT